jgi:hypothetical protein
MKKTSSEVLIYIQNLKQYFVTHLDAQKYFTPDGNDKEFFDYMTKISQKNFDEHGEAQLTLEQFEEARIKTTKEPEKAVGYIGLFMSLGDFGRISFN